jgi:hypothetical protein
MRLVLFIEIESGTRLVALGKSDVITAVESLCQTMVTYAEIEN